MTHAVNVSPVAVQTRPMAPDERNYIFATARRSVASAFGDRFAHWETVARLTDAILGASVVTVAQFPADPDIMGYVANSTDDGAVEFIYLRRALVKEDAMARLLSDIEKCDRRAENESLSTEERGWATNRATQARRELHAGVRIASQVARALLPARTVVMRRAPKPWILEAMVLAGCTPSVVPVGL